MERIRFYRLLMRFFLLKWRFVFMLFYGGESFKLPFFSLPDLVARFCANFQILHRKNRTF